MTDLAAVILAAGSGSRLGGVAKAMLREKHGRKTFLAQIVATARAAGVSETILVVGPPFGDEVAAHGQELGCRIARNPAPERGMASSVAVGFSALSSSVCSAAFLWPVDHPRVSRHTLVLLGNALDGHLGVRPIYQGKGGHPPLIARELWPQLAVCADVQGGARAVLAEADVLDIAVDDPGCVRDVDTLDDLESR